MTRHYEQFCVPSLHEVSTFNLVLIGLTISEEMSFEKADINANTNVDADINADFGWRITAYPISSSQS